VNHQPVPPDTTFLALPDCAPAEADVALLPLPFEGAVSYGGGTADGPAAIWDASAQVELFDYELRRDLDAIAFHNTPPVIPGADESAADYLARVARTAESLHSHLALPIAVGGDHSLTPPLLRAAIVARDVDPTSITVVHIDAHADLRDEYEGDPNSHACAMARALDMGARVLSVGIRSAERSEFERSRADDRVITFPASSMTGANRITDGLHAAIADLRGPVYLTFDIDALDTHLAPATGTPEPGGLDWWFTLDLLTHLILHNSKISLIGADVVETVPQPGTSVNEFVAAKLIAKIALLETMARADRSP